MRVLLTAMLLAAALPLVAPAASACHVHVPPVHWSDGGENWLRVTVGCDHRVCAQGSLGLTHVDRCAP